MELCGISFPENARFEISNHCYELGAFTVASAYLYVYAPDNGNPEIYLIPEITSGLEPKDEIEFLGGRIDVKLLKSKNGNGSSAMAEATSGRFKGEFIFFKIKKAF